jgi:hypothetical protein
MSQKLPISRWQRDLTDSTVLRNMGVALGYTRAGLRQPARGLDKLELNAAALAADLDAAWEVLAEPIQTVMRRHGLPDPYEQLKDFTRGQPMTRELMQGFIAGLASCPPAEGAAAGDDAGRLHRPGRDAGARRMEGRRDDFAADRRRRAAATVDAVRGAGPRAGALSRGLAGDAARIFDFCAPSSTPRRTW